MKRILPVTDVSTIKDILRPVYDEWACDNSPCLADYVPTGVWIELKYRSHTAGIINLQPIGNVLWIPHIYIYAGYRGHGSEEWGHLTVKFMKEQCGAQKFLVITPITAAKNYAERMGFSMITVLKNSIEKDGKLMDQYVGVL